MEELIKRFEEHKTFEAKIIERSYDNSQNLLITNKNGNKEMGLIITEEDLSFYKEFNFDELELLNDFMGFTWKNDIYIQLSNVSLYTRRMPIEKNIDIKMNYKNNNLNITIGVLDSENEASILMSSLRASRYRPNKVILIKISDFINYDKSILSEDIRCITDSVLFDLSSNFKLHYEPTPIDDHYIMPLGIKRSYKVPDSVIEFSYKNYIPELLGYYRNAEKVNYLPFKYLCYYSILEYFLDKSAYFQVSKGIKSMLLKPDFHLNIDYYVSKAVKLVKKENEKHLTDKIKIQRVFNQYIEREELVDSLKALNMLEYFSTESILKCNSEMKLIGINFNNDSQFYENLTSRIYRMRCSVVHSNPDFDEEKAIPFVATSENLAIVRQEIVLIEIIAKNIILNSTL